jgi:hypothetical protein
MTIRELIAEINPEALLMDGFDNCILGICERIGQPSIVAYDVDKIIDQLHLQGMTMDEAREYFEYNQLGAFVGDSTPCFIQKIVD